MAVTKYTKSIDSVKIVGKVRKQLLSPGTEEWRRWICLDLVIVITVWLKNICMWFKPVIEVKERSWNCRLFKGRMIDDVGTAWSGLWSIREPESTKNNSVGQRSEDSEEEESCLEWLQSGRPRKIQFCRCRRSLTAVAFWLELCGHLVRPINGGHHPVGSTTRVTAASGNVCSAAEFYMAPARHIVLACGQRTCLLAAAAPSAMNIEKRHGKINCPNRPNPAYHHDFSVPPIPPRPNNVIRISIPTIHFRVILHCCITVIACIGLRPQTCSINQANRPTCMWLHAYV